MTHHTTTNAHGDPGAPVRSGHWRRTGAVAALGVAALTLAACGGGVVGFHHNHRSEVDHPRRRLVDAPHVPRDLGHHRGDQRQLARSTEPDDRSDDGQLHVEHDLPPDHYHLCGRGDRGLVHLRLRQAHLRVVVHHAVRRTHHGHDRLDQSGRLGFVHRRLGGGFGGRTGGGSAAGGGFGSGGAGTLGWPRLVRRFWRPSPRRRPVR